MRQLRRQGATYEEIARMFNRSTRAIEQKFSEQGWTRNGEASNEVAEPAASDAVPAKKRSSLDDFQPREIIKYLYNLGYRIENNRLVYVHRQVINIKNIIDD